MTPDDDVMISKKATIEALQAQLDAMPQSVTTDTKGHYKREMDFEQGARVCLMHNIEIVASLPAAAPVVTETLHEMVLALIDRTKVMEPSEEPLNDDERIGWHQGIKDFKYALARQSMLDAILSGEGEQ